MFWVAWVAAKAGSLLFLENLMNTNRKDRLQSAFNELYDGNSEFWRKCYNFNEFMIMLVSAGFMTVDSINKRYGALNWWYNGCYKSAIKQEWFKKIKKIYFRTIN